MYLPPAFAESDPQTLAAFVTRHPLGTLITADAEGLPVADKVPFVLDTTDNPAPRWRLRAHVARANPLWRQHPPHRPVRVVFEGPQAYVSPSWYPGKAEHGRVVPTWNYSMVQLTGTLQVVQDPAWLRDQIEALTRQQEGARPLPWRVDDAPADYLEQMLRAVVGLDIQVTTWQGKFKLSQNHPEASRLGVIAGLTAEADPGAQAVAALMLERDRRTL